MPKLCLLSKESSMFSHSGFARGYFIKVERGNIFVPNAKLPPLNHFFNSVLHRNDLRFFNLHYPINCIV